jgi:hypothetical protein
VNDTIIIDDSGSKKMHNSMVRLYSKYNLIINEKNIGLVESIDKAYTRVTTPYIFHSEDDFDYIKPGFIERCISVMEHDPKIFRVGIRGFTHRKSFGKVEYIAGDVKYKLPAVYSMDQDAWGNQFWFGFGFQCGMIRKSAYDLVRPYTQYSTPDEFITIRECRIGLAYHALGLLAVSLTDDYAMHTGGRRSTYGLRMDG